VIEDETPVWISEIIGDLHRQLAEQQAHIDSLQQKVHTCAGYDRLQAEYERQQAEIERLRELVQRTVWHAERAHLILPPEMVREFRAALSESQKCQENLARHDGPFGEPEITGKSGTP
jgi:multidrug resistance efflux pump